ncbi:hypothetical protein [Streptomyces sp. NBC_00046]|uniref:hypothetical protein n=1 Tax=unclassified Streptomyces TaxID=2593676 RepID=UPI003253138C
MAFLSSRRRRPRLVLELDDAALGRLLKSLQATTSTGTIATTDLCMTQVSRLLDQSRADWDCRTHRLSVLAYRLSASHGPRSWATREPRNASALVLSAWAQLEHGRSRGRPQDAATAVCAPPNWRRRTPLPG